MIFDCLTPIPRLFGLFKALISLISILDAITVTMILPGQTQTVRPFVRILDRVARRGVRHGLPHPEHADHAKWYEETTSRYIGNRPCIHRCPKGDHASLVRHATRASVLDKTS